MLKNGAPPDNLGVLYHHLLKELYDLNFSYQILNFITLWFIALSKFLYRHLDGMGPFKAFNDLNNNNNNNTLLQTQGP